MNAKNQKRWKKLPSKNHLKFIFFIILINFIGTSCQSKKLTKVDFPFQSLEVPTETISQDCKKVIESMTLILRHADLKKISFNQAIIQTHWIDNTFSFFAQKNEEILEKSAKYKLLIKGKSPKNQNKHCKLTIFKNQKIKINRSAPWRSSPTDGVLENLLFSKLTAPSEPIEEEDESEEIIEEDTEEESIEAVEEEMEDSPEESIESIEEGKQESIEDLEDESIESIEDVESLGKKKVSLNLSF